MTLPMQSSSSSRANDNSKKYEDCKAIIQSLLISTARGLTAVQLERDYDELEGQRIPFLALGYSSLESLLRSMGDVLRMRCMGNTLLLEACATPETAHVRQLVQEQKKTRSSRGRGGPLVGGGSSLSRRGISCGSSRGRSSSSFAGRPYFYKRAFSQPPARPLMQGLVMDRQFVPGFTQNNLVKMMLNYPEGVPMDKLSQLYYDQFGHPLRCAGHNNPLSIVTALPHLFSLRDHYGCTFVYSKNGLSVNQCNVALVKPATRKTFSVSQSTTKPACHPPPEDEEEWGTSDEEEVQSLNRESAAKEGSEPHNTPVSSRSVCTTASCTVTSVTESVSGTLGDGISSKDVTRNSPVHNESRAAFGSSMTSISHEMTSSTKTQCSGSLQDANCSGIHARSNVRNDTSGRSVAAGYPGLCATSASALKRAVVAANNYQAPVAKIHARPASKARIPSASFTRAKSVKSVEPVTPVVNVPKIATTKVETLPAKFVKNFLPTPIRGKPVQIWPPPETLAGRDNQAPFPAGNKLENFIIVDGKFEYESYLDNPDGPDEDCPVYIPGNPTPSSNSGVTSIRESVNIELKQVGNTCSTASRPRLFSLGNLKTKTTQNSLKVTALALAGKCGSAMNESSGTVFTASPSVQKFADSVRTVRPLTSVSKTNYENGYATVEGDKDEKSASAETKYENGFDTVKGNRDETSASAKTKYENGYDTVKGDRDEKSASAQLGRPRIDKSAVKALLNKAQNFAKEQSKYDPLSNERHVLNSFADRPNNTINKVMNNQHANGDANGDHNILSISLKASATTIRNGTNHCDQQNNLSASLKPSSTAVINGMHQDDRHAAGKTSRSVGSTQQAALPSASCHIPRKVLDGLQVAIENMTNPHNINPDQILPAYQNATGESLSLSKLGLVSILELVKAVPHLLTITYGRYGGYIFAATASVQERIQKRPLQTLESIRLRETLNSQPQGLTEDQLLQAYRGDWPACPDDLWYPARGYSSLAELLQTAPENILQLHYRRRGPQHGDITLNTPQDVLVYPAKIEVKESFEEGSSEEVWEPQEKRLRPPDAADPGQQYKTVQEHPLLQAGGVYRDVMVAEVFSPRNFWILYDRTALDDLMEKIRAHFERTAPWDGLLLRQEDYKPGAMVAANYPHDGDFYRAAIVAVKKNGKAEVFCVDYGTLFTAERNMVMYLPQQFADIPALALHACLWGIAPSERSSGGRWQGATTKRFLDLVYDAPHTATTRARLDNTLLVSLTNEASEGVSDVAKRLVLERFAIRATEVILSEESDRNQISDALSNDNGMKKQDDILAHSTPLSTLPTECVEQGHQHQLFHSAIPENVDQHHESEHQPAATSVCDGLTTRAALSSVHYSEALPSQLPVQGSALHIDASTSKMVHQTVQESFDAPQGQVNGSFPGLQGQDDVSFHVSQDYNHVPQVVAENRFSGAPTDYSGQGLNAIPGYHNTGGVNGCTSAYGGDGAEESVLDCSEAGGAVEIGYLDLRHVNDSDYSDSMDELPGYDAMAMAAAAMDAANTNLSAFSSTHVGEPGKNIPSEAELGNQWYRNIPLVEAAQNANCDAGNVLAPSFGLGSQPQKPASSFYNNAPEDDGKVEYSSVGQRSNLRSASAPPTDTLSSSTNYFSPYDVVSDGRVNNSFSHSLLNPNVDGDDLTKTDLNADGIAVSNKGFRDSKACSQSNKNEANVFTLDQLLQFRNLNVKQHTHLNNINNINITNNLVEVAGARLNMGKPIVTCNTLPTGPFDTVQFSQSDSVSTLLDHQSRSVIEQSAREDAFNLAAPCQGWAGDTVTNRVWANEGDQGWLPNNQSASQVWANHEPNQVWSSDLSSNRFNQDQMFIQPQQQQLLLQQQQFGSNTNHNSFLVADLQLLQNNQKAMQQRQLHQQSLLSNMQQQQFPLQSSNQQQLLAMANDQLQHQQQLVLFQQQQQQRHLGETGGCAGDRASGSAAPLRVADRQLMETAMTSLVNLRSDLLQQLAQFPDREDIIIQLEDIKTKLKRLRNLSVELA